MNRRELLQTGAVGAASLGLSASTFAAAGAAGDAAPSSKVRLAFMGVRGRGADLARNFLAHADAEIVALCDIDDEAFAKAQKVVTDKTGKPVRTEKDYRRILDDKTVDALVIAAPDHWHAPATIQACLAGKDVYVEKPVSHNVVEGRRMVETARKTGRVVQTGTQRRSGRQFARAAEFLAAGKLGRVLIARSWIIHKRPTIGKVADSDVPAGVDYDLWLGAAPKRAFNKNHFHYNWHWFWEYGTGELGNNGVHGLDVARWVMGAGEPLRVHSAGGRFHFDDDQVTPDTQIVHYELAGAVLQWEHRIWYDASGRNLKNKPAAGTRTGTRAFGVAWHCEKGTLHWDGGAWTVTDSDETFDPGPSDAVETLHARNFLDCIRTRGRPSADIEIGASAARLCHLGNISHRLGRSIRYDAASDNCGNDAEANALLGREYRKGFELGA